MLPTFRVAFRAANTPLDRLIADGPKATARALNRSIASGRTFMARAIAQELGLAVGVVRDQLAIGEATVSTQRATLTARGTRIPLIDFRARGPYPSRGRGAGVTASLPPPAAGRYPHAFIAVMPAGHRGVFERTPGKYMRRVGRHGGRRQAIHELRGPSLPHVFEKYMPQGLAYAEAALAKNLDHEFAFVMRGAAA